MEQMDKKAFERHLDASWQAFRQQLLDAYPVSLQSSLLQPAVLQEVAPVNQQPQAAESQDLEKPVQNGEKENSEQNQAIKREEDECDEDFVASHPSLLSGLAHRGSREAESVKNRLRLRLGILSPGLLEPFQFARFTCSFLFVRSRHTTSHY